MESLFGATEDTVPVTVAPAAPFTSRKAIATICTAVFHLAS